MKTVTFKASADGKEIVAAFDSAEPTMPVEQKTIAQTSPFNKKWVRQIQVSNEFIFLKRYGCPTVGMKLDDFVSLCISAEPGLTFPPIFSKYPTGGNLSEVGGFPLSVQVLSELPVSYKWQKATGNEWTDLDGQDKSDFTALEPAKYRCVASNAAGQTTTEPAIILPMPIT